MRTMRTTTRGFIDPEYDAAVAPAGAMKLGWSGDQAFARRKLVVTVWTRWRTGSTNRSPVHRSDNTS